MFDKVVFHLMRVVLQEHTACWASEISDVTKPQYAVLEALDNADCLDQLALGQAISANKATLTEMIVRMESRGLINRRIDVNDSRRRLLTLTQAGRDMLARARPVADAVKEEILAPLSAEERQVLTELLGRIKQNVRG